MANVFLSGSLAREWGDLPEERRLSEPGPAAPLPSAERPVSDEVRLVSAAARGDRAAFSELYARYARMVHGVLLARVPYADAEDLLQDVFLQAMERLSTLRDPLAFGGWLATIARNRATDFLRRAPRTTELPDDLAARDDDRTEAVAVLAIIRTLPEAYRETLVLRLVEGCTGPEIAAQTGLTEGSVRVNLHRGMKQLREHLERGATRDSEHRKGTRPARDTSGVHGRDVDAAGSEGAGKRSVAPARVDTGE